MSLISQVLKPSWESASLDWEPRAPEPGAAEVLHQLPVRPGPGPGPGADRDRARGRKQPGQREQPSHLWPGSAGSETLDSSSAGASGADDWMVGAGAAATGKLLAGANGA